MTTENKNFHTSLRGLSPKQSPNTIDCFAASGSQWRVKTSGSQWRVKTSGSQWRLRTKIFTRHCEGEARSNLQIL